MRYFLLILLVFLSSCSLNNNIKISVFIPYKNQTKINFLKITSNCYSYAKNKSLMDTYNILGKKYSQTIFNKDYQKYEEKIYKNCMSDYGERLVQEN